MRDARVTSHPESAGTELVLSGLAKAYGGVVALRGVDLVARTGAVHGLIGENGAGKSTLVKILSGAIAPDAGEIRLGENVLAFGGRPAAARSAGIATAFQELSLVPDWDVATNLLYGREPSARAGRIRPRASRRAASAIMRRFGIDTIKPDTLVSELRLAERQVLEIMRALSVEPRILILDEPTSALAPAEVDWFYATVRSFVARDRLVLFISHRLEEIETLCDQVTVLRDGRDVGTGAIAAMPEQRLVELMLGEAGIPAATATGPRTRPESGAAAARLEKFSSRPELEELDLEIGAGEIVGVAGLEGQGQLELFLALYGARRSSGTLTVGGKIVRPRNPAIAMREGIGLVPHDRGLALCLPLSIRDNIGLGALDRISRFGLIDRAREAAIVKSATDALRVRARSARQAVETLSGGNQQKVLLGRVLARRPRLLLMYDATRGVDIGTRSEIFQLMRAQADDGVGILYYSTDVSELIALCDRVVVIHDGGLRAELRGEALSKERIIAAAIGGART
jgi:ribose transport system ATP-binding protein